MDKTRKTVKQLLDLKQQSDVISIAPEATVLAALKLLADRNIGAAVVVERDRLVGILSERDYARKVELAGRMAGSTQVRDIMTTKVITVRCDQTVEECRKLMGDARIRHLPVVDGERVIGVLSSKDILDEVIAEDEKLIKALETERLMTTSGHY
jgi:CBS domain-containing protein